MGLPVWRSWRLMGSVVDTGHPFCGSEDAFDEQVLRLPVVENTRSVHKAVSIVGTIYKPRGEGPFPLVVINHGSNRNAVDRVRPRRFGFASQSREFIRRGFVVLVPTRRGYGDSEGPLVESYQRDETVDFHQLGLITAVDIRAAIDFMRQRPYVDSSRIVIVGHSAGGYGCLALGSQSVDGLKGVINFNGVRGSRTKGKGSARAVVIAIGKYGETTTIPSLWIYSENDSVVEPSQAREMYEAFSRSCDKAEFIMLPPFEKEGHYVFTKAVAHPPWIDPVGRFLSKIGMVSEASCGTIDK